MAFTAPRRLIVGPHGARSVKDNSAIAVALNPARPRRVEDQAARGSDVGVRIRIDNTPSDVSASQ
jgi:hypothetical protein